jgi:hypothetical protein
MMSRDEPDPELIDLVEYVEDTLDDYERLVRNIGNNGYTAPMLLYYRDELQETLDLLNNERSVDTQPYWRRLVDLDKLLRACRQEFVDEVGHANFKQYQIINDPPPQNWWWFLNKETKAPPPPAPFWQFWNRPAQHESIQGEPQADSEISP